MRLAENVLAGFTVVELNAAKATLAPSAPSPTTARETPSLERSRTGTLRRRRGLLPGPPARPARVPQLAGGEQQRRDDDQKQPAERPSCPPEGVANQGKPEADEPDRAPRIAHVSSSCLYLLTVCPFAAGSGAG